MKQNWTYKKLGEICETTSGGTPSKDHKEYYEGGTIPWLRSGEVANRCIMKTELSITQEGVENSSAKLVPINSVVVAMYGATVGQVGILKMQTTTNQAVCSILPNDSIMPEFLYYTLVAHKKNYLEQAVGGAQPNISQQIIKNTTIPVPPLAEQQRIVSELDLLQGIMDKQQAQLKELDTLAQSIFYDMFGDPVENEKGWEVKRLGEVCDIVAGGDKPDDISSVRTNDYCFPVIANGDGEKGILGYSKTRRIDNDAVTIGARGASIGNCRIVYGGFTPVVRLIVLSPNDSVNCTYLYYFAKQMPYYSNGAGQAQLTVPNVKSAHFTLPPLSLQQEFAEKIEKIERQKSAISQSIAETRKLFDYTMDKYFG